MKKAYFFLVFFIIINFTCIKILYSQNFRITEISEKLDEAEKYEIEGHKHEKEGNLEKALECYQRALKSTENIFHKKTLLRMIGQIYIKEKNMMKL